MKRLPNRAIPWQHENIGASVDDFGKPIREKAWKEGKKWMAKRFHI
jgi:hypothetical protein